MTRPGRARRFSRSIDARRQKGPEENGFTIVEMAVSMLILSIFLVMFMTSMVHIFKPTLQTESMRDSSDQLDLAFLDLDSQVRYAYEIWQPYQGTPTTDDNWDIEYESTFNGAIYPTCTELQYNYNSGELLSASWTQGSTVTPSFKILANDLTGTGDPFQVVQNSSNSKVQLMVTLSATSGTGGGTETTSSSVTFTALNSTNYQAAATSNTQCTASWTSA
jgi:prepilin-type N-terminal cleavage/methylation domain-containing protein